MRKGKELVLLLVSCRVERREKGREESEKRKRGRASVVGGSNVEVRRIGGGV